MRTTAALIVLCCVTACLADDTYRLSPFNPAYDTINQKTLRNFELLPQIPDADILRCNAGTKSDAEAFARSYIMRTPISNAINYKNVPPTKTKGKHTIDLYGPANIDGKRLYFWVVKGIINHQSIYWFSRDPREKEPPKEGFTNLYTVIFYQTIDAKPKVVFYIIDNRDQESVSSVCNQIAAIVDPEHKRLTKERHDTAIKKDSWTTLKGKQIDGKLESYKNGRLTLRTQKGSTNSAKADELSLDDQDTIRGYLDQLEIPAK